MHVRIVPASHDEYTALVKSGDVASKHVWKQSRVRIVGGNLDTVTCLLLLFFCSARVNWCSCASIVIFSNSVVINSLSSFSVPFSVTSMLPSARCMSLLSVGVVE